MFSENLKSLVRSRHVGIPLGVPIWRPKNSGTYSGYLRQRLSALNKNTTTSLMAENHAISEYFSTKLRNFMSRTAITPKFKMHWFPNDGRY